MAAIELVLFLGENGLQQISFYPFGIVIEASDYLLCRGTDLIMQAPALRNSTGIL